jgi:outer membrane protein OmpA-like peptidoglycan-associated protein
MSVGSNLQEMENVVTKGAAPADPMPSAGIPVEDLGGPTPENYRPDDDSAKLKDPAATLAQVKDVVNAKAAPAEAVSDEIEDGQEIVAEEEVTEEEVVSEEEETSEEVVAEQEEVEAEFSIEEDVNALLEGEELSEEFQEKARTIFEAAIKSKVGEIKEQLQATYEQALVEEIVAIKEGLEDRVDAYLEYVADEWIQENALQVEHGLKTEMTESFLVGMKSLFEDHYVTIPEDRYDVIESMVDKLDEMETKLNEQIERNVALNRRLAESTADVIFAEVAEGLALSQKDKLATLAENVGFESESDYREKLATLRESYFPSNAGTQRDHSETISEGTEAVAQSSASPIMESYMSTLKRVSRK